MTSPTTTARALVLQHLAVEHLGSLEPLLRAADVSIETVELDDGASIPNLEEFGLLIVMGGPTNVWEESDYPWIATEKAAIRHWVRTLRRPYLGICLGHQMLAAALGGKVGPMEEPEVGVVRMDVTVEAANDPLFSSLASTFEGLQWHGAEITHLPRHSTVLATNENCGVQAFRVGENAWGLQFHVEVLTTTVGEWAQVPAYSEALKEAGIDSYRLGQEVSRGLPAMTGTASCLVSSLLPFVDRSERELSVLSPYDGVRGSNIHVGVQTT
jgi:GMP synthase-like glutamine amidotransferase